MKAGRGAELSMEDNDLEWYGCSDVYFEADLNDIPLQSSIYGTPVAPMEK